MLLWIRQHQFCYDIGSEEVGHIQLRNGLVIDRQAKPGGVLVGTVQIDGAHAHHPGPFSLLRHGRAGRQRTNSHRCHHCFLHHHYLRCDFCRMD
ncbi:hypothetical protein D3C72_1787270 [compost metagenome]